MSFPRYPKYKDSGVEWLGEVPEHWEVKAMRTIADVVRGASPRPAGDPLYFGGDFVPWVTVAEITKDDRIELTETESCLTKEGAAHSKTFVSGTVVYSNSGATLGVPKILQIDACANDGVVAFERLSSAVQPKFLYHFLASITEAIREKVRQGSGQPNLNTDIVKALRLAVPPFDEQSAIEGFLDQETAKIDELVAEQRRLIDLLKEKRQAVISHAVTKGLNPNVPLRPSGIEWLGDVPAHWSVAAVRFHYTVQLGKMLDTEKITGKHLKPYLRVFDVQWGAINVEDLPQMDFDPSVRERFRLTPGDLLINEGGSYPGRSAIWNGELEECYFQKALHRLRPCDPTSDTTRFFFYIMAWATALGVFTAGGNESTIEHLPAEKFRKYRFAFPPMLEQIAIADFLDRELCSLNALIAEAERTIELLQERRTALISAAVTGKLDVREFAYQETV